MGLTEDLASINTTVQRTRDAGEAYRREAARIRAEVQVEYAAGRITLQARDDYVRERTAALRTKAIAEVQDHREGAVAQRKVLRTLIDNREKSHRPAGADAVPYELARDRVRRMLNEGHEAITIVRQAENAGDRTMLEALRVELYYLANQDTLSEAVARAVTGGDEERDPLQSVHALRRHVDQALIPISPPELAEARRVAIELETQWPKAQIWLDAEAVNIDSGPTLTDAITALYAGEVDATATTSASDAA